MAAKRSQQLSIGIDLGGTKIAAGLVNSNGEILAEHSVPTGLTEPPLPRNRAIRMVIGNMAALVREMVSYIPGRTDSERLAKLRGIGLASAGPLNVGEGKLINPANFPGWKTVPIVDLLRTELQRLKVRSPLYFQNDAIAAALGEGWVGSARGNDTFVVVTVGTGIGSGVILNGVPAQSKGMGSEWGHMMVDFKSCGDLSTGFYHCTVEGLASGTGLLRRAQTMGFGGDSMRELVAEVRAGETNWRPLFDDASTALAGLFYSLSLGFHLEKIVVGGGLMKVQDLFFPKAKELYKNLINAKNPAFRAPVTQAKLGNKAGFIGAARLAYSLSEK